MDEVELIVKDAKSVLSDSQFHWFVKEFMKLLKLPLVRDWHARSIRILEPILDCDNLLRRLYSFFQKKWGIQNHDLDFLMSIYVTIDGGTFRRFFDKMVRFASLEKHLEERHIVGHHLLEIVRERENQHRLECKISDTAFPFRFYEKFRFLFDAYLTLTLPRYEQLLLMMKEHKTRGAPNNEYEIQRLRNIAFEFFGPNELLTHRFLDYCTGDTVKSDSVASIGMNHPLSNFQNSVSSSTVGQCSRDIRFPNPASPISEIPVRHDYPVECPSTLGTPTTALVGNTHPVLALLSHYSPIPDSATSVEQGDSAQGIRISEHPTLVSPVPDRYNYPGQNTSAVDNQHGELCPGRTPGYQFPVIPGGPRSLVNDPQTSKSLFRSSFSAFDYFKPLVTVEPDLNDESVPPNQLPCPAKLVEKSPAEEYISASVESFKTISGLIPEARTKHCSTQDLDCQPLVIADPDHNDGNVSTNKLPGPVNTSEASPAIMEPPVSISAESFGTSEL